MAISKKEVEYIANLARLKLSQQEVENYTHQLNDILKYMEKLNELDTSEVKPLSHPIENSNVFREDELKPSVTIEEALKNNFNHVLIDTAGRLHNKINLMNELTKIKQVMDKIIPNAPHEVLLVLDGSTGQNAFEQAKQFTVATDVNALAITKLDGTSKGGVVLGVSDQFKIPVKYIGIGEKIDDLQLFDSEDFVATIFS